MRNLSLNVYIIRPLISYSIILIKNLSRNFTAQSGCPFMHVSISLGTLMVVHSHVTKLDVCRDVCLFM